MFTAGQTVTSANPLTINVTNAEGSSPASYTINNTTYPRGVTAFHCMKYEITQGQYVDFLNTIGSVAQTNLFPNAWGYRRHRITAGGTAPNVYSTDRPNRASNYLGWRLFTAYLDWAALRPMTELEFMKSCRGFGAAVSNEYAWGSPNITYLTTISTTVPTEDGSEIPLNANANCVCGSIDFGGGADDNCNGADCGNAYGPMRNGLFALPTTSTREASGASYWGIMELTGNIHEYVVALSSNSIPLMDNTPGDGNILVDGHDVATWPSRNLAPATNPDYAPLIGMKGASYWDNSNWQRIEVRYWVVRGGNPAQYMWNNDWSGGRGVR